MSFKLFFISLLNMKINLPIFRSILPHIIIILSYLKRKHKIPNLLKILSIYNYFIYLFFNIKVYNYEFTKSLDAYNYDIIKKNLHLKLIISIYIILLRETSTKAIRQIESFFLRGDTNFIISDIIS